MSNPPFHAKAEQCERLRAAILSVVGNEVGWSVRAAKKLGIGHKTVSHWVCGTRNPSLHAFVAIADMTGKSLDWLVRGR